MIGTPQPHEYASFYARYIEAAGQGDIVQLLTEAQEATYHYFISLPPEKHDYAYAEGKWTVKEVLGHLIDTERIFAYRVLRFARRDQKDLPGFEQDDYVAAANSGSYPLADLAWEFRAVRQANLYLFRSLTETQSFQTGSANGYPVSVRALLYIIAGHEQHHLNILRERY